MKPDQPPDRAVSRSGGEVPGGGQPHVAEGSMIRKGPLARLRVLDLTRVRAGPTCVRHLADWGADVIMIEMPTSFEEGDAIGGPRHGADFWNLHRNKRSLTLNLKASSGRAILQRLVADADVLVENFRPDVKHRLGVDYESMRTINPRLVYASISGFGQDGPYSQRPGFDQVAQGMGGLMSITGWAGRGPLRAGIPVADLSAGNYAAMGILIALIEREVSGAGQWVRTSLLQAQIAMLDFQAARWLIEGDLPSQSGNEHPTSIPTGVFPASDGNVNIATTGQQIWRRLCHCLDAGELLEDPAFLTDGGRSANRARLNAEIGRYTARHTSDELITLLNAAGVPCGPIYTIDEVFDDPQVRHLNVAAPLTHPEHGKVGVLNQAIEMSRTPAVIDRPTPERGEHTEDILRSLGYSAREITAFRRDRVI